MFGNRPRAGKFNIRIGGFTPRTVKVQNSEGARIKVAANVTMSKANHDFLVEYLNQRLLATRGIRDPIVERMREIDKELAGHKFPSSEDRKRIQDNRKGLGPKTVDENIQFALMQLDEAVTFLMGIFAPPGGMYGAITSKDKQQIADGFSALMNEAGRNFQHYRHVALFCLNALKYNLAPILTEWHQVRGQKITGSEGGQAKIDTDALLEVGNRLEAVDPYNFGWDPGVNPIDVPSKGEFIFAVDMIRPFILKMMEAAGEIFDLDRIEYKTQPAYRYYKTRPLIATQYQPAGAVNWDEWFKQQYNTQGNTFDQDALERVRWWIWMKGSDFGLTTKTGDKPAIYRIEVINSTYITSVQKLNNVYGKLPCGIVMPNEDGMLLQARTFAEMLLPFQRFASAQINIHQRASRKRLYGVTVYDSRVIPFLENEMLAGGKIAANPIGLDTDLRKSFVQLNDAPDTSQTMDDVDKTLGLMQRILPTTQSQQVAQMERATRYQAASFVQASNRRNLKLAKMIDDQGYDPVRRMQMSNIMQYAPAMEVIDPVSGKTIQTKPEEYRGLKMQFAIADGLRGLDVLLITESLHDVINMLLQSNQAHGVDIMGIINYWLNMQGDQMDFTQFKYASPIDGLDPQSKDLAFQLLQKAMAAHKNGQPGPAAEQATDQSGGAPQQLNGPTTQT